MTKLRLLSLLTATCFITGGAGAMAGDAKTNTSTDAVKALTGTEKKSSRKKKAVMCAECGKPESECECEGHKDEKGHEHKEEDGHKH